MRSSKSRSRSNKNRNNRPSGGNIINRVFDSSGPDGKVRGTPQQIIEKYNQLHRDAQLSNDRVNAENFAQHAEHYTRLLAEAQREIDRAREDLEAQNRDRQAERDRQIERDRERQQRLRAQEEASAAASAAAAADAERPAPAEPAQARPRNQSQPQEQPQNNPQNNPQNQSDAGPPQAGQQRRPQRRRAQDDRPVTDPGSGDQPDLSLDIRDVGFLRADDSVSTLVETPEERQQDAAPVKRAPRPRKPRVAKTDTDASADKAAE